MSDFRQELGNDRTGGGGDTGEIKARQSQQGSWQGPSSLPIPVSWITGVEATLPGHVQVLTIFLSTYPSDFQDLPHGVIRKSSWGPGLVTRSLSKVFYAED